MSFSQPLSNFHFVFLLQPSVPPWEVWRPDYFLICHSPRQLPVHRLTGCTKAAGVGRFPTPALFLNNVEAGREACHGGSSGPPRLWPAVLLGCPPAPQVNKAGTGRNGNEEGEEESELSCQSAPQSLAEKEWETGRSSQTESFVFMFVA